MKKIILSASILSADFSDLKNQILLAEKAGVDWIHIDVMDGHFVPNISMGPFIVETCKKLTKLPLDVHLMIEAPEKHIQTFHSAGADRMSLHIENNPNIHRTIQQLNEWGCKTGIVLNPGTPAPNIISVLPLVDMVLVMTVNPGFSGQCFIPEMLPKIRQIRTMIEEQSKQTLLQVDGGISTETLPLCHQAGANCFVASSAIFQSPDGIIQGVKKLISSLK
jgi:ribulose-phosphate 3-epimerase